MALVAAGGSSAAGFPLSGPVGNAPALPGFSEPFGRIDLAGITLNIFGGGGALEGPKNLLTLGGTLGMGDANDGTNDAVDAGRRTPCWPARVFPMAGSLFPIPAPTPPLPTPGRRWPTSRRSSPEGSPRPTRFAPDPAAIQQHGQDGLRGQ